MPEDKLEIKPTPGLVSLISQIEYQRGRLEKIAESPGLSSWRRRLIVCIREAKAAFELDSSPYPTTEIILNSSSEEIYNLLCQSGTLQASLEHSAPSLRQLGKEIIHQAPLEFSGQVLAQLLSFPSSDDELDELYSLTLGMEQALHRGENLEFLSSAEELVFPTVNPAIIEDRLGTAFKLVRQADFHGELHPLLKCAVFHLLFLQAFPYQKGSHRFSLILAKLLLKSYGYGFVNLSQLVKHFAEQKEEYFASLRQAEKNLYGNWQGINVWLEFYLSSLLEAFEQAIFSCESFRDQLRLTQSQRRIIQVVRDTGSASREKIANSTGIKLSTVKYNLGVLTEKGHLIREGRGRATSYRVS